MTTFLGWPLITVGSLFVAWCCDAVARNARARVRSLQSHTGIVGASAGRLQGWLDRAAIPDSAHDWLLRRAAIAGALVLVLMPIALPLAPLAGIGYLGWAGVRLAQRARLHGIATAADMAEFLDAIAASMRSGMSVEEAFFAVPTTVASLRIEQQRIARRIERGDAFDDALTHAATRAVDGSMFRSAAAACAMAARYGGRAIAAIEGLAAGMRVRDAAFTEMRTHTTQARLSAMVMVCSPIGYFVFMFAVDPSSTWQSATSPAGVGCIVVGLVLDGLAAWWIRRLIRGAQ
jgi:tight adherence protein B